MLPLVLASVGEYMHWKRFPGTTISTENILLLKIKFMEFLAYFPFDNLHLFVKVNTLIISTKKIPLMTPAGKMNGM